MTALNFPSNPVLDQVYTAGGKAWKFNGVSWTSVSLADPVSSFNTRTGDVTLESGDVTGALGFTPYNSTNPAGYTTNTGDVVGPVSSTDNSLVRFDTTTGKLVQNSTVTLDDTGSLAGILSEQFDTTTTPPTVVEGTLAWDSGNGTLESGLKGGTVTYKLGQQEFARVYNGSGSAMTKGQVVYITGAQGNRVDVRLARANAESTSAGTIGFVTEAIANGSEGFVQVSGTLPKLDTSALTAGAALYLSAATAGAYTTTRPAAPNHTVILGWVERVHANAGSIYVKVDNGYELDELHNVLISSVTGGNVLSYDSAAGVWKNGGISGTTIDNTVIGGTTPAAITGTDVVATGNLKSLNSINDEGGELFLAKPQTNNSIAGSGVVVDIYQNKIRIFEQGSPNRGAYIDLTAAGNSVSSNLLSVGTTYTAGDGLSLNAGVFAADSTVLRSSGSYADPAWLTSVNYSKLTGTVPTWNQNTTGSAGSVAWSGITSKPTTLAGYGITDAAAAIHTHQYFPLTGGTLQGPLTVSSLRIPSANTLASGINWYSSTSKTWTEYYADYGGQTGCGPSGNITSASGWNVYGAALHSFIDDDGMGYNGWVWETGTSIGQPSAVAELSSYGVFTAASFNANTDMSIAGQVVLHALNYNSYALPISGGTLTGDVTLSGGTANGVTYLNGSKVLTSGSALTFNGTNLGVGTASTAGKVHAYGTSGATTIMAEGAVNSSSYGRLEMRGRPAGAGQSAGYIVAASTAGGQAATNIGGIDFAQAGASGNASFMAFSTHNGTSLTEKMRLDPFGNLALGRTPDTWTTYSAFQLGAQSSLAGSASYVLLSQNFRYDGTDRYIATGTASQYYQGAGSHVWRAAASGTAGAAISFTSTMTLSAVGALNTAGAITQNGSQVLTAGNYNSYALPLSGGTLSGNLSLNSGSVINLGGQSDTVGYNATAGLGTYIKGTSGTYVYGGGSFYDGTTHRTLLHAGNYTSYNGIIRALGAASTSIDWNDLGNSYQNSLIQVTPTNFTSTTNGPTAASYQYGTLLNLSTGSSSSRSQVYISHNGNDLIFRGGWDGAAWTTWNKVLTNQNYTSYSPSLTGTGASGTWGISVTGSAGSVAWTNVSGRPTAVSSFTNDSGYVTSASLSGYLPTSGGSMTGAISLGSLFNLPTNSGEAKIGRASNLAAGIMTVQLGGGNTNSYFEIADWQWNSVRILVAGTNAFTYKGNNVLHAGNYSTYYTDRIVDTAGNYLKVTSPNNLEYFSNTATIKDLYLQYGGNASSLRGPSGNIVLHAGNASSYSLPIVGGTVSGQIGFSVSNFLLFNANTGTALLGCNQNRATGTLSVRLGGTNASQVFEVIDNTTSANTIFSVGTNEFIYNGRPIFAARAWVNFNGTGTVAIRASGNVSSITDGGVGTYTVNFTTAMPDTNYVALSVANEGTSVTSRESQFGAQTTAGVGILTRSFAAGVNAGALADISLIHAAIFR